METAKDGDTVKVHYKGTLRDGTVFDDSEQRDPLELTLGSKQVIPGFEEAIVGMKVGDSKVETIPAAEAYGEPKDQLILRAPMDKMPEGKAPEVGQQMQVMTEGGQPVPVRVTEVSEDEVTLDANHPLAGHDLTFELKLVEIT